MFLAKKFKIQTIWKGSLGYLIDNPGFYCQFNPVLSSIKKNIIFWTIFSIFIPMCTTITTTYYLCK